MIRRIVYLPALAALLIGGCGGDGEPASESDRPAARNLAAELDRATQPRGIDFPSAAGKTLEEVAAEVTTTGPEVGLATSVFRTGTSRLAFGVIDDKSGFVYGPTAVYVARRENERAKGPFLAPADLLVTEPAFRSKQAATEDDPFSAVYSAQIELDRPGEHKVLVVTKVGERFVGAPTQIKAIAPENDRIPGVGDPAPKAETDTVGSARGNLEAIDTRLPPDDMHRTAFSDVIGKKPVALLFATPQLCQSRVCGPVTDIALQLKARYGDQMEFIHQEVYVDNDPQTGIRKSLSQFSLVSEPWLFTFDASGKIAARLEGSFGLDAFEGAVKAAL